MGQAKFITFEGQDGSGKSTHLKRVLRWMEERDLLYHATQEPGGTPLGEALRSVFLDRKWGELDGRVEAMVVFASRRQHLLEVIEPGLASGKHVICDRFTDSTHAYQGAGRGLDPAWIDRLDELATDHRQPDFTFLFDLPAEATHARRRSSKRVKSGNVDRLDVESLQFYERVRARFLERAKQDPERFCVIDSSGATEDTWRQVEWVLPDIFADSIGGAS